MTRRDDLDRDRRRLMVAMVSEAVMAGADPLVQRLALLVVTVAAVLGGQPARRQRRLVTDAWNAVGQEFSTRDLQAVYRAFIDGQGIAGELERALEARSLRQRPAG